MDRMENRDLSLSATPPIAPTPASAGGYPSHAAPPPAPSAASALAGGENPFGAPASGPAAKARSSASNARGRIGSALAALGALVAKFGVAIKGLLVALPNLKLLVTAGTALVSVAAYSLFFGWWFAAGFVALLFVHEMGHVIQLRREGIKATAPVFLPFMGAVVGMRQMPDDALAEARVGLAGPVLGTIGAAAVAVVGAVTGSDLLLALAYFGFLINLFNLLPVVPLDGGRAAAAMSPWMWFAGLGVLVALVFLEPGNPILLIIALFAGYQTWHRWQQRKTRSLAQAAYYRVAPRHRLLVFAVYVGLIVALVFGMSETHILASGGHSFRSI
jgi:Zn-dependent protease